MDKQLNYVPYRQLIDDTMGLVGRIPADVCGIVGIPRSGMIPAGVLATALHLPLLAVTSRGLINLGQRKQPTAPIEADGRYLLIDDSAHHGLTLCRAIRDTGLSRKRLVVAVVYAHQSHFRRFPRLVDVMQRLLPSPRLFEWNIFNHSTTSRMMADIDGVICVDPVATDDDNDLYGPAIAAAEPLHLPRRQPLHTLITHRLERWRDITSSWLLRNGVKWQHLVMAPYATAAARRQRLYPYGHWKGIHFQDSACRLFIESSQAQAIHIHKVSRKPVICLEDGKVYQR